MKFHLIAPSAAGREFVGPLFSSIAPCLTIFLLDVGSAGLDNEVPTRCVPKLYGTPLSP